MDKRLIRQLEQQFGSQWACSCRTPFDFSFFEIISETDNTLLAHYSCPACGNEQMIAIAGSGDITSNIQTDLTPTEARKLLTFEVINANDVLDIREELKEIRGAELKNLRQEYKSKTLTVRAATSSSKKIDD
jgi:hypothetical protein